MTTKREQRKRDKEWVKRHMAKWVAEQEARRKHETKLAARARTEARVLRGEQGNWNDKPWDEQLADARYVLRWCPWMVKHIMKHPWWPMPLDDAKKFEALFTKVAGEIGIDVDDVLMLMQVPEADRKDALAVVIINREIAAGRMEPPTGWLEAQ
jgi:hypothetical protein